MASQPIPRQRKFSDKQFAGDLMNLFQRHRIQSGEASSAELFGTRLKGDEKFRSQLFSLCTAISHMSDVDLSGAELLALIGRALGVGDSSGKEPLGEDVRSEFLSGLEAWESRDLNAPLEWPTERQSQTKEQDAAAGEREEPDSEVPGGKQAAVPGTRTVQEAIHLARGDSTPFVASNGSATRVNLESMTLKELNALLAEIESRVSAIRPHVNQMATKGEAAGLENAAKAAQPPDLVKAAPLPELAEAAPLPDLAKAVPLPDLAEAAPLPELAEAAPLPDLVKAAPLPELVKAAAPLPGLAKAAPLPDLAVAAPLPELAKAAPLPDLVKAALLPDLAKAVPLPDLARAASWPNLTPWMETATYRSEQTKAQELAAAAIFDHENRMSPAPRPVPYNEEAYLARHPWMVPDFLTRNRPVFVSHLEAYAPAPRAPIAAGTSHASDSQQIGEATGAGVPKTIEATRGPEPPRPLQRPFDQDWVTRVPAEERTIYRRRSTAIRFYLSPHVVFGILGASVVLVIAIFLSQMILNR